MPISPYLFFDGTCREAMQAYAEILGGEILAMIPFSEMPEGEDRRGAPPDHIMHAAIRVGDDMIMASDDLPGKYTPPAQTHVMAALPTLAEARAAFDRLAEGGEVRMAFAPTFWSEGFGVVRDRWGQLWMISVDSGHAA